MADFVIDTFTEDNDAKVDADTNGTGATWTQRVGDASNFLWVQGNALAGEGGSTAIYTASGTPASPDYDVHANMMFMSADGNVLIGILGRCDTNGTNYYRIDLNGFNNTLVLSKNVAGTGTTLGSIAWTEGNHKITLRMDGDQISALVDDAVVIGPEQDNGVELANAVGLYKFAGVGDAADFFRIADITASDADAGGGGLSIPIAAYHYNHHLRSAC